MNKKKVLFVGSFKNSSKDGSVGGQMFACKTILNSNLSESINWTLIDSTANSNILSSGHIRLAKALFRFLKFLFYIIFYKYDYILIFVGDGWSFWEKGVMSLLGKYLTNSKVVLAPRSGFIIKDISENEKLRKFILFVFKKVDTVICQSSFWKVYFEEISSIGDSRKFIVIENILDDSKYNNRPSVALTKDGNVRILYLAWVTREKGIFELIEAIKLLKNDNLSFKLTVAGKGQDFLNVVSEVEKQGLNDFVSFPGWVLGDDKLDILYRSDIFVLPTYFDGYPNSLLEAMASGNACIATRVGSIPDIITDMKNGILVDKKNSRQLYEQLKRLIQNSEMRQELALNAMERIEKNNSINVGIQKYKELFST